MRRITDTAARQPGHLGSDLQPPSPQHPDEWVIIYQFADQPSLDAWIASPVREALLDEGTPLTRGKARVQRVAMGAGDEPVTAVASFRVRAGHETLFAEGFERLLDSLQTFDGYLRAQLFPPVEGVQDDTVIVFSFQSREELDVWLQSRAREELLAQLDTHLDGERQVNVVDGFGGWFSMVAGPVPTWKQATIVLVGLFPTVLVLNEILDRIIPDSVPYVLDVLIGLIISVVTLSWLIMPRLTSTFSNWLHR